MRPDSDRFAGSWTGSVWKRSDPWLTSFVDCSSDGPGSLLGLAPGRTGACVREWLGEQTEEFRNAIKIVVIDPSAPYASGIRAALPKVKIAIDMWHLVALANQVVTEVRQRITRDLLGRRGTVADPMCQPATAAHRRRTPQRQAVAAPRSHARLRPNQRDWRRLGREGTAPHAARRVGAIEDPVAS
jgi:transposase